MQACGIQAAGVYLSRHSGAPLFDHTRKAGAGPDGWLPHGAVPPGARFDPISPLVDPEGASGTGGWDGGGCGTLWQ